MPDSASTPAAIVIAGAGECGTRAAFALREQGCGTRAAFALREQGCGTRAAFALREQGWDGRVILAGAEPSPPYERPPLSKSGELKPICGSGALREADITFLPGVEAAGLDTVAHILELADGRRLPHRSLYDDRPLRLESWRVAPDPAALADPGVTLKSVLRSSVAG